MKLFYYIVAVVTALTNSISSMDREEVFKKKKHLEYKILIDYRQSIGLTGYKLIECPKQDSLRYNLVTNCIRFNFLDLLEALLKLNIHPTTQFEGDHLPIAVAAEYNNLNAMKLLFNYGAQANQKAYEETALHRLCIYTTIKKEESFHTACAIIDLLMEKEADINSLDEYNCTPLMHIAMLPRSDLYKNYDMQVLLAQHLLRRGALTKISSGILSLDSLDNHKTPYEMAIRRGKRELAELIKNSQQ